MQKTNVCCCFDTTCKKKRAALTAFSNGRVKLKRSILAFHETVDKKFKQKSEKKTKNQNENKRQKRIAFTFLCLLFSCANFYALFSFRIAVVCYCCWMSEISSMQWFFFCWHRTKQTSRNQSKKCIRYRLDGKMCHSVWLKTHWKCVAKKNDCNKWPLSRIFWSLLFSFLLTSETRSKFCVRMIERARCLEKREYSSSQLATDETTSTTHLNIDAINFCYKLALIKIIWYFLFFFCENESRKMDEDQVGTNERNKSNKTHCTPYFFFFCSVSLSVNNLWFPKVPKNERKMKDGIFQSWN